MKKTSALKKFLKPVLGILGLAIVIVWSGGFLTKRVKPSKVDFQPGIPLPEDAARAEFTWAASYYRAAAAEDALAVRCGLSAQERAEAIEGVLGGG